jgi:hypothetical protein
VEELVSRIRAENKPWLRWAKDWPAAAAEEAAKLVHQAEEQPDAQASAKRNSALSLSVPGAGSSSVRLNNPGRGKDGWDTLALYFIEFQSRRLPGEPVELQTKVVFEGPGKQVQERLPGIEPERVCQWILNHFENVVKTQPETAMLLDTEAMLQGVLDVSVSQLRLFQPAGSGAQLFSYSNERPKLKMVKADQPFDLEAILEPGQPPASANGHSAFCVRFYANQWGSHDRIDLGNAKAQVIEDQATYSARLQNVSLPRGRYQLRVLAVAQPKPVVLGSIDVPLINVW